MIAKLEYTPSPALQNKGQTQNPHMINYIRLLKKGVDEPVSSYEALSVCTYNE